MVKNLPQNEQIEKVILGIALMDVRHAFTILSSLQEEDFSASLKHKTIFNAMLAVQSNNDPIDIQTVTLQLENMKELDNIGGVEYLVSLAETVTGFKNLDYYIKSLKDITLLRILLLKFDKLEKEYESKNFTNIPDFISKCEREVTEITNQRRVGGFTKLKDLANEIGKKIATSHGSQDTITGLTTGFPSIDKYINGLNPGNIIIVAARPSIGKSALGLNIAYLTSKKNNKPVCIFSLEMDGKVIMQRLLANRAGVDLRHISTGYLNKDERMNIEDAINEMQGVQLYIDDNSSTTIDDIALQSRKLKEELGSLGLIVIDYLGLIDEGGKRYESDQIKMATYSRKLKKLAGELQVPILIVAQLNRDVDDRVKKIPQMSDIRQSGQIEADADTVLLLYRDSYYTDQGIDVDESKKSDVKPIQENNETVQNTNSDLKSDFLKINIAKNRNGQIGTVTLSFLKPYGRFDELAISSQEAIEKYSKY